MKDLYAALSNAQKEISGAKKDESNPFYKSKYADLSSVWEAIRIPLTKNGLSICQLIEIINDKIVVKTRLQHNNGAHIESTCPVIQEKPGLQGLGSAITYIRRYTLSAIVCCPQVDDDGEGATDHTNKAEKSKLESIIIKTAKEKIMLSKTMKDCEDIILKLKEHKEKNNITNIEYLDISKILAEKLKEINIKGGN